ncbi:MAG TPA: phosphoenolpyruvate--protein phosphotransferase [bacterium (Candidatus Stahlbacteria)]|nr:phosphoenolpyruvate--protein phosphotransferase [Candidatus Stahlbacteria bacterium]
MDRAEVKLRGVGAAPGISRGKLYIFQLLQPQINETKIDDIESEIGRFVKGLSRTEQQLNEMKGRIVRELTKAIGEFLEIQIIILKDKELIDQVKKYIKVYHINAEFAFQEIMRKHSEKLLASKSKYFQDRSIDLWDLTYRVIRNLKGLKHTSVVEAPENTIIATHDLPPSEAALLNPDRIVGLACEVGGETSHTAIMAKSFGIPAVLGIDGLMKRAKESVNGIIDGYKGLLIINPKPKTAKFYYQRIKELKDYEKRLNEFRKLQPITRDGRHIELSANIELPAEVLAVKKNEAEGIGLFRTEFLYLSIGEPPSEEDQFEVYSWVVKEVSPKPVIIRTYDLGGDKFIPNYEEANPFLGLRAIRFCLTAPEIFKTQLRAILRASHYGNVKIMFPMISTLEELKRAKMILKKVIKEMESEGIPIDHHPEVGIMVETPSAALLADRLARQVDFFSIGSNDLTQYVLAVDRSNLKVANLFDHFHPSVLRLIKAVVDIGHKNHIWVGLCGELASDPLGIILLLGFGIDELSMNPMSVPTAKKIITSVQTKEIIPIAMRCLEFSTALEVKRFLNKNLRMIVPPDALGPPL